MTAKEFTGKRALVTGGTKGVGEAIVNRLLRGGAKVLATARTSTGTVIPNSSSRRTPPRARGRIISDRASSITGSEYVIDGGNIPTI
jgi:nucleoside-diphosphate-sugar epimerase